MIRHRHALLLFIAGFVACSESSSDAPASSSSSSSTSSSSSGSSSGTTSSSGGSSGGGSSSGGSSSGGSSSGDAATDAPFDGGACTADGTKNGGETGVDCGGTCTAKCAAGQGCATDLDCQGGLACNVTCKTPYFEGFEGLMPPALPTDWASAGSPGWSTETGSQASGGTVYVYADGFGPGGDVTLTTKSFAIDSATARMSFRSRYFIHAGDGAVLEIAIDGGAFQDILAAGGTFTANGYSAGTIANASNPLNGRAGFQGTTSATYRTVAVSLPAAASGKNVALRFRIGGGSDAVDSYWFVDSVTIVP